MSNRSVLSCAFGVVGIFVATCLALGCGAPDTSKYAGDWIAEDAEATKLFGEATYVTLYLNSDMSARLLTDEGKWHMEGEQIIFETDETNGALALILMTAQAKPAQSIRLTINSDDTMTWKVEKDDGSSVREFVFRRKDNATSAMRNSASEETRLL